jgi:hypothetical protein
MRVAVSRREMRSPGFIKAYRSRCLAEQAFSPLSRRFSFRKRRVRCLPAMERSMCMAILGLNMSRVSAYKKRFKEAGSKPRGG